MKFFKKTFLLSLLLIAAIATLTSCNEKKKVTLSAEKAEITVAVGDNIDLGLSANSVKGYTEEAILSNLEYKTSDKNIVKVDSYKLIAVGVGSATITATWKEFDGATASVIVNVEAPKLKEDNPDHRNKS